LRRGESPAEGLAGKLGRAQGRIPAPPTTQKVAPFKSREELQEQADALDGGSEQDYPDEQEWTAAIPPDTDADIQSALSQSLSIVEADDAALDQLWDWARNDMDRAARFLGTRPATSTAMRGRCETFAPDFYALSDSTLDGDVLVGFVALIVQGDSALMRFYLAPTFRDRAQRILLQLMQQATKAYEEVKAFTVAAEDPEDAKMFRRAGFTMAFMLTWTKPQLPDVIITLGKEEP